MIQKHIECKTVLCDLFIKQNKSEKETNKLKQLLKLQFYA